MAGTTPSSIQSKLRQFEAYASFTGFEISVPNCMIAVFGKEVVTDTVFMLHDKPLQKKKKLKYIGVHHQTGRGSIYKDNYQVLADKAKNAAGAVLHAKAFMGSDMPIRDMITMYWARIDPDLKSGAKFIMDVVASHREQLEEVQHYFLRRVFSLQKRSSTQILFTETGVMPIRYRRIILFFKNVQYLVNLPHHHLAWKAFSEAYSLAQNGHTSIILEACRVLDNLPIPFTWNIPEFEDITTAYLNDLITGIQNSMEKTLQKAVISCPRTIDSLKERKVYD
ncbi:hypothetical protein F5876DRAFT_83138 [Lentinula aff. lateritia]|uniref:Uncharacterized protein n=1 Tax=Lentinula aff. lateritia TaxID=2804960 RepID=A0ACC1TIE5_9AGAR|nr:hypothetical protein F5876DRAFT_83138 [Lentinula aff. lateritia]